MYDINVPIVLFESYCKKIITLKIESYMKDFIQEIEKSKQYEQKEGELCQEQEKRTVSFKLLLQRVFLHGQPDKKKRLHCEIKHLQPIILIGYNSD